ncbi:hypothetical protein F2P81_001718 [Scophthalmus maximus]|uniref:Uncharacterized protein n=1 Tax=Scophthalmus maximus TaxID=52904 RepID=A0A6A4TK48_SCOMX|nr:hypothetical protein F2P81_001718 [Scophthalmus maximus]
MSDSSSWLWYTWNQPVQSTCYIIKTDITMLPYVIVSYQRTFRDLQLYVIGAVKSNSYFSYKATDYMEERTVIRFSVAVLTIRMDVDIFFVCQRRRLVRKSSADSGMEFGSKEWKTNYPVKQHEFHLCRYSSHTVSIKANNNNVTVQQNIPVYKAGLLQEEPHTTYIRRDTSKRRFRHQRAARVPLLRVSLTHAPFDSCLSLSYSVSVKHNNKCIRSER